MTQNATRSSVVSFPDELAFLRKLSLHEAELRSEALATIHAEAEPRLHLCFVQAAMDVAYEHYFKGGDDDDSKVTRLLMMRVFNALASSLRLLLSGYAQNAAMILRDITEASFLLDVFRTDRSAIASFRAASLPTSTKAQREKFTPIAVRKVLDARDGYTSGRRAQRYKLMSELAAHFSMKSDLMMRPEPDGNAVIGPFHGQVLLPATLFEMALHAGYFGETALDFLDENIPESHKVAVAFEMVHVEWHGSFNSKLLGDRPSTPPA